jgi:hypothetical protein
LYQGERFVSEREIRIRAKDSYQGMSSDMPVKALVCPRLYRLLKNSKNVGRPWKSGPLGPRKSFEPNPGFSPRGRIARAEQHFFRTFSGAVFFAHASHPPPE